MTSKTMEKLEAIETRLVRVESRIVQIMTHFGIKAKGAIPEAKRRLTKTKGNASG